MDIEYSYRPITDEDEIVTLYSLAKAEGLLWVLYPDMCEEDITEAHFFNDVDRPEVLLLGGYIDDHLAGFMTLRAFGPDSYVGEVGVCSFRRWVNYARPLFTGAMHWCFENVACSGMIGRVPAPNRHIVAMLEGCGFRKLCRAKKLTYYDRKRTYVDGWLVYADADSLSAVEGEKI